MIEMRSRTKFELCMSNVCLLYSFVLSNKSSPYAQTFSITSCAQAFELKQLSTKFMLSSSNIHYNYRVLVPMVPKLLFLSILRLIFNNLWMCESFKMSEYMDQRSTSLFTKKAKYVSTIQYLQKIFQPNLYTRTYLHI